MKKDKCCDDSSIFAEHLFHAPLPLFQRLQRMFQAMLSHEIVPHQFQRGTIVPIVKDNQGDKGDLNNYRGITISPISSKLFAIDKLHVYSALRDPIVNYLVYDCDHFDPQSETDYVLV